MHRAGVIIMVRTIILTISILWIGTAYVQAEDCRERDGRERELKRHVYAAHTVDWAEWVVVNSKPYTPNSPLWLNNYISRLDTYFYVVNGSAQPSKVRLSAFKSNGDLSFETDRCVEPGQVSALITSSLLDIRALLAAETFVITSDEPILIDSYATFWARHFRQTSDNNDGFSYMEGDLYTKRNIRFKKVNCKKKGYEFFCSAATIQTPWYIDAGPPPPAIPWSPAN